MQIPIDPPRTRTGWQRIQKPEAPDRVSCQLRVHPQLTGSTDGLPALAPISTFPWIRSPAAVTCRLTAIQANRIWIRAISVRRLQSPGALPAWIHGFGDMRCCEKRRSHESNCPRTKAWYTRLSSEQQRLPRLFKLRSRPYFMPSSKALSPPPKVDTLRSLLPFHLFLDLSLYLRTIPS